MGRRKSTLMIRLGKGNHYRLSFEDDAPSDGDEATVEVKITRTTGRARDRRRTRSRSISSSASGSPAPRRYPARSARAANPNYGCSGCKRGAQPPKVTKPSRPQKTPTENVPKTQEEPRSTDLLPQIPPSPPTQTTQESDIDSDTNARSTTPTPPRKKNKTSSKKK